LYPNPRQVYIVDFPVPDLTGSRETP